jgi:(1->4)-alpha-D-glucan 1-alpha-D-glucosylmutase
MSSIELRATYRLQLSQSFGFAAARSLVPYLRDLGISHLYLSPALQARAGSTHGYDVVDPGQMSIALGGEDEFRRLSAAVAGAGMGIIQDIVPNHMAADDANRYWADPVRRQRFFDLDPFTGRHRRFFDIDDLAGVRQEDPEVFEKTNELAISLVRDGLVDGLRIDHIDGLADPVEYLSRLRSSGVDRVWVEKILGPGERLREWPVTGTVGYEFLVDVGALFVDPEGEPRLSGLWQEISGDRRGFDEVALEAKLEQVEKTFWPEVEWLMRGNPPVSLEALQEGLASLSVYRTYIEPSAGAVDEEDRQAVADLDPELRRLLLLEDVAPRGFIIRFQQTTPAVMAKGVEDTAFYRYGRLIALNDVGGDPGRFGIDVDRFHAANSERCERFPLGLVTTMTHDAKRSGDVRARIGALASVSDEWATQVDRWFSLAEPHLVDGAPDPVERYFLFQTLVGAWPIAVERLEAYLEKALREAKRNTSWVAQNAEWESAVRRFCRALLADPKFLAELEPFVSRVAVLGERAYLGQIVLKLTSPGVPDTYQGDELRFGALVDPDNRRPVDWEWREAMLARLMGGSPPDEDTYKLWVTARLLGLRARRPQPFLAGYEPLDAGPTVCAFIRGGDVLVIVSVRPEQPTETIELPRGRWRDVLEGDEVSFDPRAPTESVLGDHGIAVFERVGR